MLFALYLDSCPREMHKLCDQSYPLVDAYTLLVIRKVYENRKAFIARVAGFNQDIKTVYSLYDSEVSEPKSFIIPIHITPKQLCLGGIKFVNSHRILGIVVGSFVQIMRSCCTRTGDT